MGLFIFLVIVANSLAFAKPLPDLSTSPELFASDPNAQTSSDIFGLNSANQDRQFLDSGGSDTIATLKDSLDIFPAAEIDLASQESQTPSQPFDGVDLHGIQSSSLDVQIVDSDSLIAQGHVTKEDCNSKASSKGTKPANAPTDEAICRPEPQCDDDLRQRYCCNQKSPRMDTKQGGCTPCS